jgi:hypothetical protein
MAGPPQQDYNNYYGNSTYSEQPYAGQGQGLPPQYLQGFVVPEWQEQNAMFLEWGHHPG